MRTKIGRICRRHLTCPIDPSRRCQRPARPLPRRLDHHRGRLLARFLTRHHLVRLSALLRQTMMTTSLMRAMASSRICRRSPATILDARQWFARGTCRALLSRQSSRCRRQRQLEDRVSPETTATALAVLPWASMALAPTTNPGYTRLRGTRKQLAVASQCR
jgi:hypothetical protein